MKIWNIDLLGYIKFEMNFCQIESWMNNHGEFKLKLIILLMMDSRKKTVATTGITRLFGEY